jgi:hypothetical protein
MSQQAARENWGKPRFEYPTCTGCSRTFVRDKLFLSDKDTKICAECRKKNMDMGKSKLPNVPQSQISNTNLITHIVSFDEAIGCIISEVVCSRGSTSFILTFIIKLDFMNKVIDNLGEDVYNEFIESLPFTIKDKEQRLIEDLSSFFERCPDRDYCYCNSSVEAAAYDAGITYANKIHSQEYEKNLKTLLNRINEQ